MLSQLSQANLEIVAKLALPATVLAIGEAVMFFYQTKRDVAKNLNKVYVRGGETLARALPNDDSSRFMLASVASNAASAAVLEKDFQRKNNRWCAYRAGAIIAVLGTILVAAYMKVRSNLALNPMAMSGFRRSLLTQGAGTIILVGAYQYYFYTRIGKKYTYTLPEESTAKFVNKINETLAVFADPGEGVIARDVSEYLSGF